MGRALAIVRIIALLTTLCWFVLRLMVTSLVAGESEIRGFRYRRNYTRVSLWILGVRLTKHGKMADHAALYVSNHRSMLDPFVQLRYIDAYIVSKSEVERYPIVGKGSSMTGVVFVKRESKESRTATKETIRDLLLAGKPVLIYPEGTTSNAWTVQDFKPGTFSIAAEHQIPVVPVTIQYRDAADHWDDGPMLDFFLRKFAKRHIDAYLSIGKPIVDKDPESLMRKARESISAEIQQARIAFGQEEEEG